MKLIVKLALITTALFAQDKIANETIGYEKKYAETFEHGRITDRLIAHKERIFKKDIWHSIDSILLLELDKYLVEELKYFDNEQQDWINVNLENTEFKYDHEIGYMIKLKYDHTICNFNCDNTTDEKIRHIVEDY